VREDRPMSSATTTAMEKFWIDIRRPRWTTWPSGST